MLKRGVQSALTRGLEQWLWFLGVDTRNPEGNLLVRNGFRKFKPPLTKGSSRYQCKWRGNLIDLHSFSWAFILNVPMALFSSVHATSAFFSPMINLLVQGIILKIV